MTGGASYVSLPVPPTSRTRDGRMMSVIFVYITIDSPDAAHRIGRILVEERLAACANLIPGMTSIYRWQGAVEEARETVIIAKTRAELFERLEARVRKLHS